MERYNMEKWNAVKYEKYLDELHAMADEKYRSFQQKLIPEGLGGIIGVRLPQVKSVAKKIAKETDYESFLDIARYDTYEETLVQSFVICFCKADLETRLKHLRDFIPHVNNWAVCDCTVAAFKVKEAELDRVFEFLKPYIKSQREYDVRVAVVFLMDYFINERYIDKVLEIYNSIKSDKYYINMALAWGLSVCFVKFPDKTMELLKNNSLNDFTYNKALQKIVESYRVDKDTKELIKAMKRKKQ